MANDFIIRPDSYTVDEILPQPEKARFLNGRDGSSFSYAVVESSQKLQLEKLPKQQINSRQPQLVYDSITVY